jgi:hypothetical protein
LYIFSLHLPRLNIGADTGLSIRTPTLDAGAIFVGHPPIGRDRAKGEVEIMLAARPQKITFGEMRDEMGVRGVLVYCADYR